jgi:putative hydrolases of HD superfamily
MVAIGKVYRYILSYLISISLIRSISGYSLKSICHIHNQRLTFHKYYEGAELSLLLSRNKKLNRVNHYSLMLMMNSIPTTTNDDCNIKNNNGTETTSTNIQPQLQTTTESTILHDTTTTTISSLSSLKITAAIEFATLVGRLKSTPRTGWVRRNVPQYESVADHSWRVAILSFLLLGNNDSNQNSINGTAIDIGKVIQLALVHDLAECIIGDITPEDNVLKIDKQRMEHDAMIQITKLLQVAISDTTTKEEANVLNNNVLMKLFNEYEERETIESIVVKDLDLLDMILQADEYERRYPNIDVSDFFIGTPPSKFQIPHIRHIANRIHEQRNHRHVKHIQQEDVEQEQQHQKVDDDDYESQSQQKPSSLSLQQNDVPMLQYRNKTFELPVDPSDIDFVTEYSKTILQNNNNNKISTNDIINIVQGLRQWDVSKLTI